MQRFDITKHFELRDPNSKLNGVKPKPSGIELICQYLHTKYKTNIVQPISGFMRIHPREQPLPIPQESENLSVDLLEMYIIIARQQRGDHRQAFVIGKKHALFMVYIKEGTKEAILCSDSLTIEVDKTHTFVVMLTEIQKKFEINVFTNAGLSGRQADRYSCYLDAILWGRETTAIDPKTGEYRMKNLIGVLEEKKRLVKSENGIFYIKIPNQLLKTAQLSNFVTLHREDDPDIIVHKEMTLDTFRAKYKNLYHDYLRQKGIKLSKVAEIQYYLNQMEQMVGALSIVENNQFINAAKKHLKEQLSTSDLFSLSTHFLKFVQSTRQEFKTSESPVRNYSDELREESLRWKSIASEGNLDAATSLINNKDLISKLANSGYLWECGNKDAFFAEALLKQSPQHFTQNETSALKWVSKYGIFQSKLCAQSQPEENQRTSKMRKISDRNR